jgi:hypothetical protein
VKAQQDLATLSITFYRYRSNSSISCRANFSLLFISTLERTVMHWPKKVYAFNTLIFCRPVMQSQSRRSRIIYLKPSLQSKLFVFVFLNFKLYKPKSEPEPYNFTLPELECCGPATLFKIHNEFCSNC